MSWCLPLTQSKRHSLKVAELVLPKSPSLASISHPILSCITPFSIRAIRAKSRPNLLLHTDFSFSFLTRSLPVSRSPGLDPSFPMNSHGPLPSPIYPSFHMPLAFLTFSTFSLPHPSPESCICLLAGLPIHSFLFKLLFHSIPSFHSLIQQKNID